MTAGRGEKWQRACKGDGRYGCDKQYVMTLLKYEASRKTECIKPGCIGHVCFVERRRF